MSKLTAKKRNALPKATFAGPGRSYPIPDKAHAAVAKGRAKQQLDKGNLSPSAYKAVVAKADRKLGK